MSLRRSYADGPSESQKLYGSNLPPSLRWGATTRQSSDPEEDEIHQPEPSRPRTASTQVHKKHDRRRNTATSQTKETGNTLGVSERSRRPYASTHTVEAKPGPLMIEYVPDRKRHDKSRLDSQTDEMRVPDHGFSRSKKSEVKTRNGEEQIAAGKPVEASETRAHHATVEDIDDVSNDPLQASATAGAEDFGASLEIVRSSDQRQEDGGQKYSGDERGRANHAMPADSTNDNHRPPYRPTYPKIHSDHLSTETLGYYDIHGSLIE